MSNTKERVEKLMKENLYFDRAISTIRETEEQIAECQLEARAFTPDEYGYHMFMKRSVKLTDKMRVQIALVSDMFALSEEWVRYSARHYEPRGE